MNMKILVTGGTGYIGPWVVQYLLEKEYTVRLTMRDKTRKDKIRHLLEIADKSPGTLELWEADLINNCSFDEAVKGCEVVIHIASPFKLKFKDPKKEFIDPALNGTKNVLSAATKSSTVKKVILTSSLAAVYGDNIDMKKTGIK